MESDGNWSRVVLDVVVWLGFLGFDLRESIVVWIFWLRKW